MCLKWQVHSCVAAAFSTYAQFWILVCPAVKYNYCVLVGNKIEEKREEHPVFLPKRPVHRALVQGTRNPGSCLPKGKLKLHLMLPSKFFNYPTTG